MTAEGLQAHFDCKHEATMASSSLVATTLCAVNFYVADARYIACMYITSTNYCWWLHVGR